MFAHLYLRVRMSFSAQLLISISNVIVIFPRKKNLKTSTSPSIRYGWPSKELCPKYVIRLQWPFQDLSKTFELLLLVSPIWERNLVLCLNISGIKYSIMKLVNGLCMFVVDHLGTVKWSIVYVVLWWQGGWNSSKADGHGFRSNLGGRRWPGRFIQRRGELFFKILLQVRWKIMFSTRFPHLSFDRS